MYICEMLVCYRTRRCSRIVYLTNQINYVESMPSPRMLRYSCTSVLGVFIFLPIRTDYANLIPLRCYRSVPTEDEILVPETLLKKRKSQEKERAERSAELEKKKKVRYTLQDVLISLEPGDVRGKL